MGPLMSSDGMGWVTVKMDSVAVAVLYSFFKSIFSNFYFANDLVLSVLLKIYPLIHCWKIKLGYCI